LLVERSPNDFVADLFVNRQALTGQQRLVHRRMAADDHAVHRNFLTGPDDDDFTHLDLLNRNIHFYPVSLNASRFSLQTHQGFDGFTGFAFGPYLQHFANLD
jgi:hypothetical protein